MKLQIKYNISLCWITFNQKLINIFKTTSNEKARSKVLNTEELLYASLPSPASFKIIEHGVDHKNQDFQKDNNSNLNLKRALSQSYTKLAPNHKNVPIIDDFDAPQQHDSSFNHRPRTRTRTKTISRQNSK